MKRLPEEVLLEIVRCPREPLRALGARLCVSTHTIQRIRRSALPAAASLEEINSALYKPALKVDSTKPPIDYHTVIEQRASGLTIKECWKVYRRNNPNGFSLPGFSALVKRHAAFPEGFVPVGGPIAVPVNSYCERIHWPEPIGILDDGANPLDGVLGINEDGSTIKVWCGDLMVDGAGTRFRFMKATHGLKAVVIDCDAMISTSALDWLQQQPA